MLRERLGNTVLRGSLWEHCAVRDWGNTVQREDGGNIVLRDRLGNTLLRERLGEHWAEREFVGKQC